MDIIDDLIGMRYDIVFLSACFDLLAVVALLVLLANYLLGQTILKNFSKGIIIVTIGLNIFCLADYMISIFLLATGLMTID